MPIIVCIDCQELSTSTLSYIVMNRGKQAEGGIWINMKRSKIRQLQKNELQKHEECLSESEQKDDDEER